MLPKIKNKIFLAPMEEVNDIAFRLICKKAGAGLTWTPLTSPLDPRPQILDDKPIMQLMGNSTRGISIFMKKYDSLVTGWDFNLGCPAKTAKNQNYGAYLEDLEMIEKIVKIMRSSTKKPLSIKIRKSPLSYNLLTIAEKYCDWIVIHPRTRIQGYSGEPDIKWALEFKSRAKIPVIYSGNVNEKNYSKLLKEFDYVMIGRSAIGRPEIFSQITGSKFKKNFKDYIKLAEKYKLYFRSVKFQAMNWTKGEHNSRKFREKIYQIKNLEELKSHYA